MLCFNQLKILEDESNFKPLNSPKSKQKRSPIKPKNINLYLTKSQKRKNKLILTQKKELEKYQIPINFTSRYKKNNLLNLVEKTKQVLKYRSYSKNKNIFNASLEINRGKTDLFEKRIVRVGSPQLVLKQNFNRTFTSCQKINPQDKFINLEGPKKQKYNYKSQSKIQQYFKNVVQNSIKSKHSKQQIGLQKQQNMDSSNTIIQSPINTRKQKSSQNRRISQTKKPGENKRPNTTHIYNRRAEQKQQHLSFSNLQPW